MIDRMPTSLTSSHKQEETQWTRGLLTRLTHLRLFPLSIDLNSFRSHLQGVAIPAWQRGGEDRWRELRMMTEKGLAQVLWVHSPSCDTVSLKVVWVNDVVQHMHPCLLLLSTQSCITGRMGGRLPHVTPSTHCMVQPTSHTLISAPTH